MVKVALELGSNSSKHTREWMVCLDIILSLVFGNDLPGKDQVAKLGPAVCVGSDWGFRYKEIGAMGHAAGP